MKLIRDIGIKLQGANEVMSAAKKQWQDDQLTSRERAIGLREEAVKRQVEEARALNRASRFRNFKIGGALLIVAIAAFVAGNLTGQSGTGIGQNPAPVAAPVAAMPPPTSEAEKVKSTSRAEFITYHQCAERGIAYYKEIGAYPTLDAGVNAGRNADDVVRELCSRSHSAFGS